MFNVEVSKGISLVGRVIVLILCLGMLPVLADNSAPSIRPISPLYIFEGDTVGFTVEVSDADGDQISIALINRPIGARFTDNGNGSAEFVWTADFSGPNSSEGSPFELQFRSSDGVLSSEITTQINVINKNRCPEINAPDTVNVNSGDFLNFDASGFDPDHDQINWNLANQPVGMKITRTDPINVEWQTNYADSGIYYIDLSLTDEFGAIDSSQVVLNVSQTTVYELSIDTTSAYPGEFGSVGVNLDNLEAVFGIDLVINGEASILTFTNLSLGGSRIEGWEYFTYHLNNRGIQGDVRLIGAADLDDGIDTAPLGPGEGNLVFLKFLISSNFQYSGYSAPVNFVFRDILTSNDNTMTDPNGEQITQDMISYVNGYIFVKTTDESSLGDVNLNGVTFEIGDAVTMINYFINPILHPLSPAQLLNSDVNHDGYGGTIADMVFIINRIVNIFGGSPKIVPSEAGVVFSHGEEDNSFKLDYDSDINLGGVTASLIIPDNFEGSIELSEEIETAGLQLISAVDGNILRIAIFSENGFRIPSGFNTLLTIENENNIYIDKLQVSTTDGYLVPAVLKDNNSLLPSEFTLHQNVPNPFNPQTEILFDLPRATNVDLTVYNVLGRQVIGLVSEQLPAGSHSVIWDGHDDGGISVASGIYFYRLTTDEFSDKKKMILLK